MWIINIFKGQYVMGINNDTDTVIFTDDREKAKQFKSRQEAKDFMAEFSITGSIIPL
jgi:hypothetical protein